jgi:hypothetical protein
MEMDEEQVTSQIIWDIVREITKSKVTVIHLEVSYEGYVNYHISTVKHIFISKIQKWTVMVQFPKWTGIFLSLRCLQTGPGAHPTLHLMVLGTYGGYSL